MKNWQFPANRSANLKKPTFLFAAPSALAAASATIIPVPSFSTPGAKS